jgi:hypothetical protein
MAQVNRILILSTLVLSCMNNQDRFVKRQIPVEIYEATIPATGRINQDIQIQLKSQATNGCYSDLKVKLVEIDSRHFLFKATALFQSSGVCPEIMVYKDTTITFKPTLTGKYFFQTNEEPFEIRKDTIAVN